MTIMAQPLAPIDRAPNQCYNPTSVKVSVKLNWLKLLDQAGIDADKDLACLDKNAPGACQSSGPITLPHRSLLREAPSALVALQDFWKALNGFDINCGSPWNLV